MRKETIVAVSGGFDPVHPGHIRLFKEAQVLGNKLIVILNGDDFLTQKKGRPFMSYEERAEVLAAIRYVDKVVPCVDGDQTVCESLKTYRPDIFANGGDRVKGNVPEEAVCKELDIKMVFNVGGSKCQSSSDLLSAYGKQRNHS